MKEKKTRKEENKERETEAKKAQLVMSLRYRNTFSSPEGRAVLLDILIGCGYFNTLDSEEGMIRRNVAVEIIDTMTNGSGNLPEFITSKFIELATKDN